MLVAYFSQKYRFSKTIQIISNFVVAHSAAPCCLRSRGRICFQVQMDKCIDNEAFGRTEPRHYKPFFLFIEDGYFRISGKSKSELLLYSGVSYNVTTITSNPMSLILYKASRRPEFHLTGRDHSSRKKSVFSVPMHLKCIKKAKTDNKLCIFVCTYGLAWHHF